MKISHAQTLTFINAVHLQGISKKTQNEYDIYIVHVAQNGERPNVGGPAVEVAGSYVFDAGCNQEVFSRLKSIKPFTEIKAKVETKGNNITITELVAA